MSEALPRQLKNHILSSLPPEDYERLAPHMETVELTHGQEVGICGYEGMVGISALLGVDKSAHLNLVQIHDGAMKCSAKVIQEEFRHGGARP